jgi:hypothetical protein
MGDMATHVVGRPTISGKRRAGGPADDAATQLLGLATRFCKRKKISLVTLGKLALNSGKFFKALQNGNGCTVRSADRVKAYIAANRSTKYRGRQSP